MSEAVSNPQRNCLLIIQFHQNINKKLKKEKKRKRNSSFIAFLRSLIEHFKSIKKNSLRKEERKKELQLNGKEKLIYVKLKIKCKRKERKMK